MFHKNDDNNNEDELKHIINSVNVYVSYVYVILFEGVLVNYADFVDFFSSHFLIFLSALTNMIFII
jgi:hypothetical protein